MITSLEEGEHHGEASTEFWNLRAKLSVVTGAMPSYTDACVSLGYSPDEATAEHDPTHGRAWNELGPAQSLADCGCRLDEGTGGRTHQRRALGPRLWPGQRALSTAYNTTMRLALAILSKTSKMLWPQDLFKRAVRYSVRLFNHRIPPSPLEITKDIFRTQMTSMRFHASDNFSTYPVLYLPPEYDIETGTCDLAIWPASCHSVGEIV
jgi:hypothetical protein